MLMNDKNLRLDPPSGATLVGKSTCNWITAQQIVATFSDISDVGTATTLIGAVDPDTNLCYTVVQALRDIRPKLCRSRSLDPQKRLIVTVLPNNWTSCWWCFSLTGLSRTPHTPQNPVNEALVQAWLLQKVLWPMAMQARLNHHLNKWRADMCMAWRFHSQNTMVRYSMCDESNVISHYTSLLS